MTTVAIALVVALLAAWLAVHRWPALGPWFADGLRAVIGTRAVAWLEDTAYGVEDRVNRWRHGSEAPQARWDVPARASASGDVAPVASAGSSGDAGAPVSRAPRDVGPLPKTWSAPGDGLWVALPDARDPLAPPHLWKTLLHPDPNRSWAEVFVVAADLAAVRLEFVPGLYEPRSEEPGARSLARKGVMPAAALPAVLAAFNGGWKTEHGHYGARADRITLVKPRDKACTIAGFDDGTVAIHTWNKLSTRDADMRWFRQTPGCMFEDDVRHPYLVDEGTAAWGATVDGETVIRRSGIGLDAGGGTLFVAITNHTTARAMAEALHHAGAAQVAQLDVNWSYPKLVTFEPRPDGVLRAVPVAKGFELDEADYTSKASPRDFFYLTRR